MNPSEIWNKIKDEYFYPAYPLCWYCREEGATELHHWLPKGLVRNRKKHKLWNKKENAFPVGPACHPTAHSKEFQSKAYGIKCFELGKETIDEWLSSLDLKIEERFDDN